MLPDLRVVREGFSVPSDQRIMGERNGKI